MSISQKINIKSRICKAYSQTSSSPLTCRTYSNGRITNWLILDKPAKKIISVQEKKKQEDSLLAGFVDALQPSLAQPWDKFINGPMPHPSESQRQPINRDDFGRIIFATKKLEKVQKKLITNQETTTMSIKLCQKIRASGIIPNCIPQKALAWRVFHLMFLFFNRWKNLIRLSSWSRKRPDPYACYSSYSALFFNSKNKREDEKGGEERGKKNEIGISEVACFTNETDGIKGIELVPKKQMLMTIKKATAKNININYPKPTNNSNRRYAISTVHTAPNQPIAVPCSSPSFIETKNINEFDDWSTSLSDPLFGEAAAFLDKWKQTRRNLIKHDLLDNTKNDNIRTTMIASMKSQSLLTLCLRFFHQMEREETTWRKKQLKKQQTQVARAVVEQDVKSSDEEETPTSPKSYFKNKIFKEQCRDFIDFIELCGCLPMIHATTDINSSSRKERGIDKSLVDKSGKRREIKMFKTKRNLLFCNRNNEKMVASKNYTRNNYHFRHQSHEHKLFVVPHRPKVPNAKAMVNRLFRAAVATKYNTKKRCITSASSNLRKLQIPVFRVLLVDDSKPFRIKLARMIQNLFENTIIEGCATPKEGVNKVLKASSTDAPIHIVIVDQIFVGSDLTGSQMCSCLVRNASKLDQMLPCVLISDYLEIDSENRKNTTIKTPISGEIKTTTQSNNIVEKCCKKMISKDVILNWFRKYIN
jgi:hypothetical protein